MSSRSGIFSSLARPLVLCFSEDADARAALASTADAHGLIAEVARDAHEAMALASALVADAIVVGRTSPQSRGTVHALRALARRRRTPMIVVLPHENDDMKRALEDVMGLVRTIVVDRPRVLEARPPRSEREGEPRM